MTNDSDHTNTEPASPEHTNPWEDWSTWRRILLMLFFGFVFWFSHFIIFAFAIIQAGHRLITGHSNQPLQALAEPFGLYIKELVDFLLYNSEKRPFPLADFPSVSERESADHSAAPSEPAQTKAGATVNNEAESTLDATDTGDANTTESEPAPAPASNGKKTTRKKKAAKKKASRKANAAASAESTSAGDAEDSTIEASPDP